MQSAVYQPLSVEIEKKDSEPLRNFSLLWYRVTKLVIILSMVLSIICISFSGFFSMFYLNELSAVKLNIIELQHALVILNMTPAVPINMTLNESRQNLSNTLTEPVSEKLAANQEAVVAHFVGIGIIRNLGIDSCVGPWRTDLNASTEGIEKKFELVESKMVKVHESGLYLIYAQLVYDTNASMFFTLWTSDDNNNRLLSTCASGDVYRYRLLRNSQISCSVQTVARLNSGEIVNFSQREHNATVRLEPGASYFGFVKLSN